jgi:uncharacterized protein
MSFSELAMKTIHRLLLIALVPLASARADGPVPNMEKYYVVLLERAPNAPKLEEAALEALQAQHIAHLRAMYEAGKMLIAGPFDEQRDPRMRGMCLYRVATGDEARALAEQDPMVKAGRLQVEVLAWWVEKGYLSFKPPSGAK